MLCQVSWFVRCAHCQHYQDESVTPRCSLVNTKSRRFIAYQEMIIQCTCHPEKDDMNPFDSKEEYCSVIPCVRDYLSIGLLTPRLCADTTLIIHCTWWNLLMTLSTQDCRYQHFLHAFTLSIDIFCHQHLPSTVSRPSFSPSVFAKPQSQYIT
jgi:hypothetical protein